MSLRGSLETVGLPDVLTLLATTGKTGELLVTGADVEGRLWVKDGHLIASDAGRAPTHLDAVFELLRVGEGTFSFDDSAEPAEAGEATDIEPLLTEAGDRLTQWADIEAVVPSLAHVVCMVADAPDDEVTVRADQWRLLAATAGGLPVHAVIDAVNLGDFDGCKALKELVEAKLVNMDEPPMVAAAPIVELPVVEVVALVPPAEVAVPIEQAPVAGVIGEVPAAGLIEEDGVSFGGPLTFGVDVSPNGDSEDESSIYDGEGGIDLSPIGSPAVGTPSWSLDSTDDDDQMTWTNDSAGNEDTAATSHGPGAGDAGAMWTHEPDGDAEAATWTHGPAAEAATWTDGPAAEDVPDAWTPEPPAAAWTQEPAAGAWTDGAGAGAAADDAAATAWTHEPSDDAPAPVWTHEQSSEPAPSPSPEAPPSTPVPAWSSAPVQADPLTYGSGAAMDSGFIPSQRATDVQVVDAAAPADAEPAADATASGERETAEGADSDEPINRGLLLKFLSSVRS